MTVHRQEAITPLRDFVVAMTHLVSRTRDEGTLLAEGGNLLASLVANDSWLPDEFAQPHAGYYRQYLLHCDPLERFSVISFVWGPGQKTPIHDHTVWGLVGILRGAERCISYERNADGFLQNTDEYILDQGKVGSVSPAIGDVHLVANAFDDRPSVSIHVYGGNIGALHRHVFDAQTHAAKDFVSGYSSLQIPNLWDRSASKRLHT